MIFNSSKVSYTGNLLVLLEDGKIGFNSMFLVVHPPVLGSDTIVLTKAAYLKVKSLIKQYKNK